MKYVALDDINQLWGCYLTNKIDPSVFDEPCQAADMAAEAAEATKLNERLHLFTWKPTVFVDAINRETTRNTDGHLIGPCGGASHDTVHTYFNHITSFVAQQHANATKGRKFLEPSSFLNVEVTEMISVIYCSRQPPMYLWEIFYRIPLVKMQRRRSQSDEST